MILIQTLVLTILTIKKRIMNQEHKQLLLKDLCARLPHDVKGRVYAETTNGEYDINGDMIFFDSPFDVTLDDINTSTEEIHVIAIGNEDTVNFIEDQQTDGKSYTIDEFKPYLRSMSSMTKDEQKEWIHLRTEVEKYTVGYDAVVDFYNSHHLDYRGLIYDDLALEAPADMY